MQATRTVLFMHLLNLKGICPALALEIIIVKFPPFRRRCPFGPWKLGQRVEAEAVYNEGNAIHCRCDGSTRKPRVNVDMLRHGGSIGV